MFNDPKMRVLLIHLAVYVVGVTVLAVINLMTCPKTLWFVWVLIGWGIAVAAQGLAVALQRTHRRERIFVDPKARGFTVHLFIYVATCLVLLAVNLIVTPQVWWFYWPMLGWGVGVATHAWCAFRKHQPISPLGAAVAQALAAKAKPPKTRPTRSKTKSAPARKRKPAARKRPARKSPKPRR
jgi:hypothetical protein